LVSKKKKWGGGRAELNFFFFSKKPNYWGIFPLGKNGQKNPKKKKPKFPPFET